MEGHRSGHRKGCLVHVGAGGGMGSNIQRRNFLKGQLISPKIYRILRSDIVGLIRLVGASHGCCWKLLALFVIGEEERERDREHQGRKEGLIGGGVTS